MCICLTLFYNDQPFGTQVTVDGPVELTHTNKGRRGV